MSKLLSIVLPTYNRDRVTEYTLSLWKDQVLRNSDCVELIVCNNASTDETNVVLTQIYNESPFFKLVNYTDHVDIGKSLVRSLENASGKYVMLWGDDDDPSPFLLENILLYLKDNDNIGLLYFNRLVGIDYNGAKMIKLKVLENYYEKPYERYDSLDTFLLNNFLQSTLLSTVVFCKEAWDQHKNDFDTSKHYGYDHYSLIMAGVQNKEIIRINYPLCIQRMPSLKIRRWSINMARYRLLGIPTMLEDMQRHGIISDYNTLWYKEANAMPGFITALLQAAAYKKEYWPLRKDIMKYQKGLYRKILVVLFILFVPSFTYSLLKKMQSE